MTLVKKTVNIQFALGSLTFLKTGGKTLICFIRTLPDFGQCNSELKCARSHSMQRALVSGKYQEAIYSGLHVCAHISV